MHPVMTVYDEVTCEKCELPSYYSIRGHRYCYKCGMAETHRQRARFDRLAYYKRRVRKWWGGVFQ